MRPPSYDEADAFSPIGRGLLRLVAFVAPAMLVLTGIAAVVR